MRGNEPSQSPADRRTPADKPRTGSRSKLGYVLAGMLLLVGALVAAAALTSASAQAEAQATAPQNTVLPAISGTPTVGQTLSATSGSWTGDTPITFTYQWLQCDTGGAGCSTIGGATGSNYTVTSSDAGHSLRVRVTATNATGQANVQSDPTAVVTTASVPENTMQPAVSGSPVQGQTLTGTNGNWTSATAITYTYQWVQCGTDGGLPDGSNCPYIAGATSLTYTLQASDVGRRIRFRVTATNNVGSQTYASNATDPIQAAASAGAPVSTSAPVVGGTAQQGSTFTTSTGSWSGATPMTFSYQWLRCDSNGNNCSAIAGETKANRLVGSDDVSRRLRARVTAQNAYGSTSSTSNASAIVQAAGAPAPAPTPSGTPAGAITLPGGKVSIPVTSVSLPARLIVDNVEFTPNPVRSRVQTLTLRVHVVDTRSYVVRDALVFARATPLLTTTPPETKTGQDGWVTLQMFPKLTFPLKSGQNVQFFVRASKAGENLLAGVSTRRLVQVRTAG